MPPRLEAPEGSAFRDPALLEEAAAIVRRALARPEPGEGNEASIATSERRSA